MIVKVLLTLWLIVGFTAGSALGLELIQPEGSVQELIGKVGLGKTAPTMPRPNIGPVGGPRRAIPLGMPAVGSPASSPVRPVPASSEHQKPTPVGRPYTANIGASAAGRLPAQDKNRQSPKPLPTEGSHALPASMEVLLGGRLVGPRIGSGVTGQPRVAAKALYCLDCSSNQVVLARNTSEPMPIASLTKLLTAMTVIDELNFDRVVEVPRDIRQIPRHRVGIRPGDMLTVKDLLHGMLIESGNDCAEVLARSYPKGGWDGFIRAMNRKAREIGAKQTKVYTPSGLDKKVELGRKDGKPLLSKKANMASAEDVAAIAQRAFKYPLIREISGMKTYTMVTRNSTPRKYVLRSNDRLLDRPLPVAGAKTGYTDLAGRCIVALFNDAKKAKNYLVVVLNSPQHFKTAEKVYNWVSKPVEAVGGKK